MSNYIITPSHHKVKRIDIWLVKPKEKLDYSTYKQVESKIKTIGGYYSKFTHSFVFEKEPSSTQLDEIFGGATGEVTGVATTGMPQGRVAQIRLSDGKVDRRTLKSEYNAGKLLVAKTQYFDGNYDTTRYIPVSEYKWDDKNKDFEREFDYSSTPYVKNDIIVMGDFHAKYKDDVIQPKPAINVNNQTSINYYVIDEKKGSEYPNKFELEIDDSHSDDIEKGTRVITAFYGKRFFGTVTNKEIRYYTIRSWMGSTGKASEETKKSVYYTVTLDNGTIHAMSNFQVDKDNEYLKHPVISAISIDDGKLTMPESFWSSKIKGQIKSINSTKRSLAGRKKLEYKQQDQKQIDILQKTLFSNIATWLGWEEANMEYARTITEETPQEQNKRMSKWKEEYRIEPIANKQYMVKLPLKNIDNLISKLAKLNQLI